MSIATAAGAVLADVGIRRLYTVPGESALGLLDALGHGSSVDVISTRHESGAGFMADAEAKLSGRPAAVLVNRAVGAANAAIAVHTARQDSTPMLVLLAQTESDLLGREAFQEIDLAAFYRPIAKWVGEARCPERVPELVEDALRAATTGRPGPAALVVPADFWAMPAEPGGRARTVRVAAPAASDVGPLAEALAEATAPVAIAGGGAREARRELVEFAERFGVGMYTAWRRQDVFPNDHAHYLGHLGIGTDPRLLDPLRTADLVIALGTRLSEITTQRYTLPPPGCRVVQIDVDAASIGATVPAELAVVSDVTTALRALLQLPIAAVGRDWSAAHAVFLQSSTPPVQEASNAIHPAAVIAALRDVLDEDAVLTNDAGNFAGFLHRYWRYTRPHTQLAPTSGAMGYAVPAAVAAKLVAPERHAVALVGDGGFLMTGTELETAARLGAPVVAVVFRNGLYGTIATHQLKRFGRTTGVDIAGVDLGSCARGLGGVGFTVTDPAALPAVLEQALAARVPAVVDVVTDPEVLTPVERAADLAGVGARA